MAWLAAKPTPEKQALGEKEEPLSRMEQMRKDGVEPDLPPMSTPWLVDHLMEIGPVVAGGMGAAPISWRDISAWQVVTGSDLRPWEARIIRRLSSEYLSMSHDAKKLDCPAPFVLVTEDEMRTAAVNQKVRSVFGAMAAAQRQGLDK